MKITSDKWMNRKREWLPDMDLNHDKQIQSLLCYRYTIGQTGASKVKGWVGESRLRRMEEWNRGMMECWSGMSGERRGICEKLGKTVETVEANFVQPATPLKRGVNENRTREERN
jgi:hypothetical protein